MRRKKRKRTLEFMFRVAGSCPGAEAQTEMAKKLESRPMTVGQWKNDLMAEIFASKAYKET